MTTGRHVGVKLPSSGKQCKCHTNLIRSKLLKNSSTRRSNIFIRSTTTKLEAADTAKDRKGGSFRRENNNSWLQPWVAWQGFDSRSYCNGTTPLFLRKRRLSPNILGALMLVVGVGVAEKRPLKLTSIWRRSLKWVELYLHVVYVSLWCTAQTGKVFLISPWLMHQDLVLRLYNVQQQNSFTTIMYIKCAGFSSIYSTVMLISP
jgi:hypothetical protein